MELQWIWKAVLIILVGTLLLRIGGRRSISQMTISTTVIMISIGTLLIQPISGKNIWMTFALAGLIILTLIALEYLQFKSDKIETLLTGKSVLVIENGTVNERNLKKLRLTIDKLEMRLRQASIEKISDVKWATIEPSGKLGYLLSDQKQFATKQDINQLKAMIQSLAVHPNVAPIIQQDQPSLSTIFTEVKDKEHQAPPPDHLN
ncbi:uncharacterized membrane protein YcaP (DUF421 family) [Pullulanibacillus pueri]|uniref:DUF421 domain-containing protein n=1 Tax=Pullulanibacillus pueri TaxID=1437324 RepID=A0A8J3A0E1_9BACL|nr:DUF421 domain-containing protein [Pullulanibacillus pueri]MBM7683891.1 uncharacterized membrane protein YcaP (DUF421 family) [Pullulanibacillus pueri]GGH87862.1 DUF421 domain-containing protein [Pullulanibacillus pueri]